MTQLSINIKLEVRKMKGLFAFLLCLFISLVLFAGCAGWPKLFEPVEPYCTAEEQADSIIYKNMNPGDTDFFLVLGVAAVLDDHPEYAPMLNDRFLILKNAVEQGITAETLEKLIRENFSLVMGVALNRVLTKFKGVNVPLSVCDKRLVLGHIDNQLEIVNVVLK